MAVLALGDGFSDSATAGFAHEYIGGAIGKGRAGCIHRSRIRQNSGRAPQSPNSGEFGYFKFSKLFFLLLAITGMHPGELSGGDMDALRRSRYFTSNR